MGSSLSKEARENVEAADETIDDASIAKMAKKEARKMRKQTKRKPLIKCGSCGRYLSSVADGVDICMCTNISF